VTGARLASRDRKGAAFRRSAAPLRSRLVPLEHLDITGAHAENSTVHGVNDIPLPTLPSVRTGHTASLFSDF
jgi:hypothetical protein